MEKLELIKAEIERLTSNGVGIIDDEFNQGYTAAMTDIKSFIDSLTEEPVNKNLEDAAREYARNYTANDNGNGGDDWEDDIVIAFKAGVQWVKYWAKNDGNGLEWTVTAKIIRGE